MRFLLTETVCGKSSCKNPDYEDFDIFAFYALTNRIEIVQDMINLYSTYKDDGRIYMMNITTFIKFKLYQFENLKVERIILPESSPLNIEYRKRKLAERDIQQYGVARTKNQTRLEEKYKHAYALAKQYFPDIEVEQLKIGEFLQQKLNDK